MAEKTLRLITFKLVSENGLSVSGMLIDGKEGLILGPILPCDNITIYNSCIPHKPCKAVLLRKCFNRGLAIYRIDSKDRRCFSKANDHKINWKRSLYYKEGTKLFIGSFHSASVVFTISKTDITSFPSESPGVFCEDNYIIDFDVKNPYQISLSTKFEKEFVGSPIVDEGGTLMGILGEYGMIPIDSIVLVTNYVRASSIPIIDYPTPSLMWSPGIRSIMRYKTSDEDTYGIYVRSVLPDSCIDGLKKGDIITHIEYNESTTSKYIAYVAYFDRYGFAAIVTIDKKVKLFDYDYTKYNLITNRSVCIDEMFELITGKFRIQIIRNFEVQMIECTLSRKLGKPLRENIDSYKCGDYVFREAQLEEVCKRYKNPIDWYKCHIIVTNSGTTDWISTFSSMKELIDAIENNSSNISIETEGENLIVIWATEKQ